MGKWSRRNLARQIISLKSCRSILNGSSLNVFFNLGIAGPIRLLFLREKGKNSQGLVVRKLL